MLMLCLVGLFPVHFFISGLHGWDESEQQELRDAVDLVPSRFPWSRSSATTSHGWPYGSSPVHDRFPARLADDLTEATTLTSLKAELY